jgi:hypothetical protein
MYEYPTYNINIQQILKHFASNQVFNQTLYVCMYTIHTYFTSGYKNTKQILKHFASNQTLYVCLYTLYSNFTSGYKNT